MLTMRDRKCDRGLADAAGADDGDEPMQGQFSRDLLDGVVSANHLRERGRYGPERGHSRGWPVLRGRGAVQGSREAIATAGHVDDIAGAFAAIAQGLAQGRDVEAQAALVDIHVSPDPLDQFPLVDDLAGSLGEKDEDVECTTAKMKRGAVSLEQPRLRKQSEGPEGNG